jgi:iron complex outermembrane receptor protein
MTLNQTLKDALAKQGMLVGAGRYFTNAIDTRTTGVDILSTYRWETSRPAASTSPAPTTTTRMRWNT